jgi:DNA-binding PadR family transcriptional regulator
MSTTARKTSRFELAPPRRFVLPALLLLLSERPAHGYALVPQLQALRFGHVDRPAVYRALAQLEQDGLVEASAQSPKAGQARRVYRVTATGERVLRQWMDVVKEEHDHLGQVLRRYQATETTDAILAEVEGGWASALGSGWSPVSSSYARPRHLVPLAEPDAEPDDDAAAAPTADAGAGADGAEPSAPARFRLVHDRSAVLVEVRSTVGPLSFGAIGVDGAVRAAVTDGAIRTDAPPLARLEIDVARLSSGNRLYDAELLRRIDAHRFPTATVELDRCATSRPGGHYRLEGRLTFHGVTRPASGTVRVEAAAGGRLVIAGEQVFDIRDFAVTSPTVLMLRIYPDVRVRLHVEAVLEEDKEGEEDP